MEIFSIYFQVSLLVSSGLLFHALSAPSSWDKAKQTAMSANKRDAKSVNCSTFPGAVQPNNLKNSAYYLLKNGSLCCPPRDCPSSSQDMLEECGTRGIVDDPCFHCMTCGKIKGEACHGHQFRLGHCCSGLSCINVNGTVLNDEYVEGVCTNQGGPPSGLKPGEECGGKFGYLGSCESNSRCSLKQDKDSGTCVKHAKTKGLNQACGGRYGRQGRCAEDLRCTVEEDEFLKGIDIRGVCYRNTSEAVCFKDCSVRSAESVCGNDGIWYVNICYLRQRNCPLLPHQGKVRKISQQTQQESICGEKPMPPESSRGTQSRVQSSNQGAP